MSTTATTRTSARWRHLAKAMHRPHVDDGDYSPFRRRRFGAPADDVGPGAALRRLLPGPRPGRQPRLRRPDAGRGPAAGGVAGRCCRRSRRCCSWARSTASWHRFSSSPTTSTPTSPRRPAPAAAGVRLLRRVRRRDPRSRGPGDVPPLEAHPPSADPGLARLYRELIPNPRHVWPTRGGHRGPLRRAGARWLVARRGPYELVCNFGTGERSSVPVGGRRRIAARRRWRTADRRIHHTARRCQEHSSDDRGVAGAPRFRSGRAGTGGHELLDVLRER